MSLSLISAEINAILERDDIENADLQDYVEEHILGTAVRDRVSDENCEILNIDCFKVSVEIYMRNDNETHLIV